MNRKTIAEIAEESRKEFIKKEIEKKHNLPLLDFSLLILTILLAIDLAWLFVKLIV